MSTMTETEAREKWCPMARTPSMVGMDGDPCGGGYPAINRRPGGRLPPPAPCRCIASACMAWRWAPDDDDWVDEQIRVPGAPSYTTQNVPPRRGYCGAFGRPDE